MDTIDIVNNSPRSRHTRNLLTNHIASTLYGPTNELRVHQTVKSIRSALSRLLKAKAPIPRRFLQPITRSEDQRSSLKSRPPKLGSPNQSLRRLIPGPKVVDSAGFDFDRSSSSLCLVPEKKALIWSRFIEIVSIRNRTVGLEELKSFAGWGLILSGSAMN
ncbi:hypothetical protein TorRG33x02_029880 [Trema orientale]|uniref:Uncharacterized protein n=1 Tax=Trema orientale TaxID=63057 RepID=A0A2P5FTW7_TREOI|nr:hypothetical protein TorRG33x02_029880 [Trema orientale]